VDLKPLNIGLVSGWKKATSRDTEHSYAQAEYITKKRNTFLSSYRPVDRIKTLKDIAN